MIKMKVVDEDDITLLVDDEKSYTLNTIGSNPDNMSIHDEKDISLDAENIKAYTFDFIDAYSENIPHYIGVYKVEPKFVSQELKTANKMATKNIVVEAIEVHRTSNPSGGKTVYIGGFVNGQ